MPYYPKCGHRECKGLTACCKPLVTGWWGQEIERIRDLFVPDLPKQIFRVSPSTLRPLIEILRENDQVIQGPCGTFMGIPIIVDENIPNGEVKLEPWEGPLPPLEVNWTERPKIKVDNPELDRISSMDLDSESKKILYDNLFDLYLDSPSCECPAEAMTGGDSHWWICSVCGKGWATFTLKERGFVVDYENRKVSRE